ncbi:S41 family peptidase [Fodinibius salsisoli]|uniref:Tail specific protease domain-containing protein n=1 Tax=Fodinibius salsisoli TaxID=2820877 RepID=A0ABT3PIC0_9BACT|nr:S41 family peptidase [Fodinibius salsisoli]MCW9705679.1 hypothetical protein [Fodinibius salsisoli]
MSFEQEGRKGNLAKGWLKWGNYTSELDSSISHSGKYAAQIISHSSGDSFGSVAYNIPANLDGKSITLKGFMKIEDVKDGFAGLLLRIDGGGTSLAFNNMQNKGVKGTKAWTEYSITLKYPANAETIYLGGILTGKGKAWFDDFELIIDEKNIEELKNVYPANKDNEFDNGSKVDFPVIDKKLVNDLNLLGKIWGLLKYTHPAIQKGKYHWDYELLRVLPKYLETQNVTERDQLLINWIDKLGTVKKCRQCPEMKSDAFLSPDLSWIKNSNMGARLKKKLIFIFNNRYQGKHFYIKMGQSAGKPKFLHENPYADMPYPDEGFRLLALYRYWNMIEYFYPYRNVMDKNWDQVLKEYIPKFINAKSELKYELAALQIIGDVQDTHANLWGGADKINDLRGHFYPPFHVRFIEEKLVVTDYYNPELKEVARLKIGDIITQINNRPVEAIVDSLKPYYPASNNAARLRNMSQDLLRSDKDEISIQYKSSDKNRKKELVLYKKDSLNYYSRYRKGDQKSHKMLDDNIGYINLESIKQSDVKTIKKTFKDTKGIIIDIRNYPSAFVPFSLGSFFVSSSTPFAKFTYGSVQTPGEFAFTKDISLSPSSQAYHGKVVVIVNEFTQSQAEYTAMAFKVGKRTTIIGNTTAGADGNISTIMLPGGLKTVISGVGVYYPDDTPTQRIGIEPNIKVNPTIEGIRKGKDELLNKAIDIINN